MEKWGDNNNDCRKSSPCLTIGEGIRKSRRNGKIIVGPGTYTENIDIDENADFESLDGLKLESSAGRYATIIEVFDINDNIIYIQQPRVRIGKKGKGFTLTGATGATGIRVENPGDDHCRVEGNRAMGNQTGFNLRGEKLQFRNNIAKDNSSLGFTCGSCDRGLISDNQIVDNGSNGMQFGISGRISVVRNVVSGSASNGLNVSGPGSKVKDNVVEFNEKGIHFTDSEAAMLQGNIAARNTIGIDITEIPALPAGFNKAPQYKNNLAVGNTQHGFEVDQVIGVKMVVNTAVGNTDEGIFVDFGSSFASFKNNSTYRNDVGGANCGVVNNTGSAIVAIKHFFGGGDVNTCGEIAGTTATRPSALKVNKAAAL